MRLIGLAVILAVSILLAPHAGQAQRAGKVWRIGVLVTYPRPVPASASVYNSFLHELRNLGYVEGQNVIIEWRHWEGSRERQRHEAAQLMAWKPDVVVTNNGTSALALQEVDASIPIVVAAAGDLVSIGLTDSLARPRGNVTGLQILQIDLAAKRLQILKELMPRLQRVALLHQTPGGVSAQVFTALNTAAQTLSVRIHRFTAASGDEVDRVFADMKRDAEAVMVFANPFMHGQRRRLAELAAHHRLPTMHEDSSYVEAGGLASYGAKVPDLYRRAAQYVDKILKGAKPGDLPIEQPTTFELVINVRTAKALGLTIPPLVLGRADQVIK